MCDLTKRSWTWARPIGRGLHIVQLSLNVRRQAAVTLYAWRIRRRWSTLALLGLWAAARCLLAQLERWNLRLLRFLFLSLAGLADEVEAISLRLLWRESVTFTVLPHTTAVASKTVRAIVDVFSIDTTN